MVGEETEIGIGGRRLNLPAKSVKRSSMNTSEQPPLAPFKLVTLTGQLPAEYDAQGQTQLFEGDLNPRRLHAKLACDTSRGRGSANFQATANQRHAGFIGRDISVECGRQFN